MTKESFVFSLNLNNAKAIPFDKYEKNFTFIVDGRRYETSRFIADLLSPLICQFHYQDETIDEYIINTDINNAEKDYFSDFLKIINLNTITLNSTQRKYYSECFLHLGNFDECFSLHLMFYEEITVDNIIDLLQNINSIINSKAYKRIDQSEILHLHSNIKKNNRFCI